MRATIDPILRESDLPTSVDEIIDIVPIAGATDSDWLLLGDDGGLTRWSPDIGIAQRLATTAVPPEPGHDPWADHELRRRLHVSRDGAYAAVVNDYGRYGEVIDLQTGRATFPLENDGNCAGTTPFSFAFAAHRGNIVTVHRTAWNRLDVSAAATGRLLTMRDDPSLGDRHYLDYFHGMLRLSPGGRRLLDDGWVWHPYGVPSVWRVDDWFNFNVWESEDGASRLDLCSRDHYWDQPMTWLTDTRVAIYGLGDDADHMRAGVRIFDVKKARPVEVASFEGHAHALFGDGDRLYGAGTRGLSIWDPSTGERVGDVPGFTPTLHHPGARELAALSGRALVRWATA